MQIHMKISNIAYIFLLYIQFEDSTTLIWPKTSSICIKTTVLTSSLRFMLFWPHNYAQICANSYEH
jgi:hypothetical protein